MNLKQYLGIDLKLDQNNAKDSILITVKNNSGVIKSASINPNSNIVSPYPDFLTNSAIEKESKQKNNFLRIIGNFVFVLIVFILGTFTVTKFLGYTDLRVVLTGSMEPAIKPGDMVFVINDNFKSPQIGDVVIYDAKTLSGEKVTSFAHRIISGNSSEGFITKGDANPLADVQLSKAEDITGVVLFTLPFIGKYLTVVHLGFLLLILISFTIVRELIKVFND